MKYIKTYESFKTNETMDMMTMPVDPIKGAADVYSDVAKYLGNKFTEATTKVEEAAQSVVEEIGSKAGQVLDSVEKYFGVNADELTYDMVVDKLKATNESFVDRYDSTDPYGDESLGSPLSDVKGGPIQKIGSILQNIFGINILTFGLLGTFLTWLLGSGVNPAMSMLYSIIGFVVVHIVRKLVAMAS